MSDLTNYYENAILSHSFENTDMMPAPATLYVALHTATPTETGEAGEVTAASYDREPVSAGSGFTTSGNTAENAVEVTFAVAAESWGTISHFSIHTAADNTGEALWYSALDATKSIDANDEVRFPAGSLTATID